MCLTVPARIIELKENKASIKISNKEREINVSLLPNVKIGDWILFINNMAIKKISEEDANEIIKLLEPFKDIKISDLDEAFKNIIRESRFRDLTKEEIVYLLNVDGNKKKALFSEANIVRQEFLKEFICIHGVIEFSNFCKNDCAYCGLRLQNKENKRYRMSVDEIVEAADNAVNEKGYKLLVLQSGEDYFYTDEMLCEIIKEVKKKCKVFIFMSVGERSRECYKKMKEAGASGVLFRFETSNSKLFEKFHLKGKSFEKRIEYLKFMKGLGYFIATGSIIGLPGQTLGDLADDILVIKKWANMVSMGPFVPCDNTPLSGEKHGDSELNLKMIAVLRLIMPLSRVPVVTALETLMGEDGRKKALYAGANALMFNLTPEKYRPHYKIYKNKFFQKEDFWEKYGLFKQEESYKMLEERMGEELDK